MNPQQVSTGTPDQQIVERLRTAVNVLITVSNNPSVDQLSAAIGFTLILNKLGKHATAVFSGTVPSTIEFLKPEETLETNTDGLRDFIISLDKSKADKLRYKVEENVVKIFITPYRTTITDKDLVFSQGDFNVDAVVALGVSEREQLDQAIVAHGRILHDATVITVSAGENASTLGAINWQDPTASSLGEMLMNIGDTLQPGLIDNQIATAYLTGIVAQTGRFRNEKTTPKVMSIAATLMAAGANQQLIANSLEEVTNVPLEEVASPIQEDDGSLEIAHGEVEEAEVEPVQEQVVEIAPAPVTQMQDETEKEAKKETEEVQVTAPEPSGEISIDDEGNLSDAAVVSAPITPPSEKRHRVIEPLQHTDPEQQTDADRFAGGPHPFSANMSADTEDEASVDPMAVQPPPAGGTLDHDIAAYAPAPAPLDFSSLESDTLPAPVDSLPTVDARSDTSLYDVPAPDMQPPVVGDARDAVTSAIQATPYDADRPEPRQSLNASPFDVPSMQTAAMEPAVPSFGVVDATGAPNPFTTTITNPFAPQPAPDSGTGFNVDPVGSGDIQTDSSAPPVPPPMVPLQ